MRASEGASESNTPRARTPEAGEDEKLGKREGGPQGSPNSVASPGLRNHQRPLRVQQVGRSVSQDMAKVTIVNRGWRPQGACETLCSHRCQTTTEGTPSRSNRGHLDRSMAQGREVPDLVYP